MIYDSDIYKDAGRYIRRQASSGWLSASTFVIITFRGHGPGSVRVPATESMSGFGRLIPRKDADNERPAWPRKGRPINVVSGSAQGNMYERSYVMWMIIIGSSSSVCLSQR